MAKDKSFASKVQRAGGSITRHCATCDQTYVQLKVVESLKDEETKAYRFKERMVPICKCNEKDYLGG